MGFSLINHPFWGTPKKRKPGFGAPPSSETLMIGSTMIPARPIPTSAKSKRNLAKTIKTKWFHGSVTHMWMHVPKIEFEKSGWTCFIVALFCFTLVVLGPSKSKFAGFFWTSMAAARTEEMLINVGHVTSYLWSWTCHKQKCACKSPRRRCWWMWDPEPGIWKFSRVPVFPTPKRVSFKNCFSSCDLHRGWKEMREMLTCRHLLWHHSK